MHTLRSTATILFAHLVLALLISGFTGPIPTTLPQTSSAPQVLSNTNNEAIGLGLDEFVQTVQNGDANTLVGVYIPNVLAIPVMGQPAGDGNFVSREPNIITQFAAAAEFGTKGLLAHNYLAGAQYTNIEVNQDVSLVYGDGTIMRYTVTGITRYQALQPNSPASDFIDLGDPEGNIISSGEVFSREYKKGDQVVFQTCIEQNGDLSWGRLFITAIPNTVNKTIEPLARMNAFKNNFEYHYERGHAW